jgi:hypothetical protein
MADKLKLSMDDLTLGEMELFEEATGKDILEALKPQPVIDPDTGRPTPDPDDPKGRPLMEARVTARTFVGLVYIALKRDNPALTLAEVKNMPLSSIELDLEESSADENPTPEAAETEPQNVEQ